MKVLTSPASPSVTPCALFAWLFFFLFSFYQWWRTENSLRWFSGPEVSVRGSFDLQANIPPAGSMVLVQPQHRLWMWPIRAEAVWTNQTNMLFWFLQAVSLVFRWWRQCHADPNIWCYPLLVVSAAYETNKTFISCLREAFSFFLLLLNSIKPCCYTYNNCIVLNETFPSCGGVTWPLPRFDLCSKVSTHYLPSCSRITWPSR